MFVTDADNREVLEYDGSSGAILRWYAYGPGPNDVLNQSNVAAGTRSTLVPDIQGSIIATLDSGTGTLTKASYRPYGESTSAPSSFGYTGQRIDPETNGLYYYRARHYSPLLGRFLQTDPSGVKGGINLYAYAKNNPLNLVDTTGNAPDSPGGSAGSSGLISSALLTTPPEDEEESLGASPSADVRGLNSLGGIFSSQTNAAGGTVVTSNGLITQSDFVSYVNSGMYTGNVNIISGVHGAPNGSTIVDQSLYDEDVETFGTLPGVSVYNFPNMTPDQIRGLLNGGGTTIGGFCYSCAVLTRDWVEIVSDDCGRQVMANGLKLYHAIIWFPDSDSPGLRVQVSAANASEARKLLEAEYGEGNVYYMHNEEEANRLR